HGSLEVPPHARLHPAGLRERPGEVPGLLPAARRGRQRRLLDLGRPRELHPGRPDRRRPGEADDRRHAGRRHPPLLLRRTAPFRGTPPSPSGSRPPADEFEQDFLTDLRPYVEKHYRVLTDRKDRAIAGLSMGGSQTLNLAIPHQEKFAYVGVFSSAIFSAFPFRRPGENAPPPDPHARNPWEEQHLGELDNADWKKGLKLVWFGTGKEDFLVQASRSSVDLLKKHRFPVVYEESAGGHTWLNWRDYLIKFAPQLFQ